MAWLFRNDWEDPRLSVEGFVNDYITWRLAVDGFDWCDAPKVQSGAESEHCVMRKLCAEVEEMMGIYLPIPPNFTQYCKVVEGDIRWGLCYGKLMIRMISAGRFCVQQAREGKMSDIARTAQYTSKVIDGKIRSSWKLSWRSWAGFLRSFDPNKPNHYRPSRQLRLPTIPTASNGANGVVLCLFSSLILTVPIIMVIRQILKNSPSIPLFCPISVEEMTEYFMPAAFEYFDMLSSFCCLLALLIRDMDAFFRKYSSEISFSVSMTDPAGDQNRLSITTLPPDIIRLIIPMTDEPYRMREISPTWNAIVLENGRRLLIERLAIYIEDNSQIRIVIRLPECFLDYFESDEWNISLADSANVIKAGSEDKTANSLTHTVKTLPFPITAASFYLPITFFQSRRLNSAIVALYFFSIWRNNNEKKKTNSQKLFNATSMHSFPTASADPIVMKLKELFDCTYRIKSLWIENVDRNSFDILQGCIGQVHIRKLTVRMKNSASDNDFKYIAHEASKIKANTHFIV